jgi:hypothetical protein
MHAANFTAFSWGVAVLVWLGAVLSLPLLLVPLLLVSLLVPLLLVPPQLALITATMATMARAAGSRSVLVMVSPLEC